jgi:membrane-associated phospholipid phosphatase
MHSLVNTSTALLLTLCGWASCASGQQADPAPPDPASVPDDRPVSWVQLAPNILTDQRRIWTLPARLVGGHDLLPTAAFLAVAAGLIALDPIEASAARRNAGTLRGFNNIFSSNATALGTLAAPLAFYATGLIRHDSYAQHTALLAGEAVADAEILSFVLKDATTRRRPASTATGGNFSDSWTEGTGLTGNGSFPSGHTIAAFSVATVVARRYGRHRWVPWVAYGLAGAVGFSRLSLSAHYGSDVFVGAALGYAVSRFTVLGP